MLNVDGTQKIDSPVQKRCRVATVLDKEEREQIRKLHDIDGHSWKYISVEVLLRKNGIQLGASTMSTHHAGLCPCTEPAA